MNKMGNLAASTRSRFFFLTIALALIAAVGVAQVQAKATTFTINFSQPTYLTVFVPCARAGQGEYVSLTGPLHVLFVTTIDNQGGFHSEFHFQPQGISGAGLSTKDKYQATGETQGTFNGKVGYESTYINNFKLIGQRGTNFLVHETLHTTVLADGTLTAYVDNFSVKCNSGVYP